MVKPRTGDLENRTYTFGQAFIVDIAMPKNSPAPGFGARLAAQRKAAGYTQTELAEALGVSQRVIAYYEGETDHPPTTLLPQLAQALGVSADELLGLKATAPSKKTRTPDTRLVRRMQQIEKLGAKEKRQILQVLDTYLENAKLKQQASG